MRKLVFAVLAATFFWTDGAAAGTLDRISQSGTLRIGVREDASPYSYRNAIGESAGYAVDLCRAVAAHLKSQLGLEKLAVDYVTVTAEDRFDAVAEGRIDLLCGATTATLSRRERVDFSIPIFVDGASVLFRSDGPRDFEALAGHKVGVRAGTTTEDALRVTLTELGVDAEVVVIPTHDEGLRQLESGEIAAYFADQLILLALVTRSGPSKSVRLSNRLFTYEPYALALQRGDDDFRLAVDRALSRIYRSDAINRVFANTFGSLRPNETLRAIFKINALPE
jgi:ABC-type amino acid transport substrate-binding protein